MDVRDRPGDEPSTVRFELPDPAVDVTVIDGQDVPRNFCTDLPDVSADPTGTQPASAGAGVLTVGPRAAPDMLCGDVEGTMSVDGLVAEDGRAFGPFRVTTDQIGCYAG